jgi:hypothetical protein
MCPIEIFWPVVSKRFRNNAERLAEPAKTGPDKMAE